MIGVILFLFYSQVVAEARDFILSLSNDKKPAHVLAPVSVFLLQA